MAALNRRWFRSRDRGTVVDVPTELGRHAPTSCHVGSEMDRIDPNTLRIAGGVGDGFSFWDFLCNRADGPELALAYTSVFWPELIEVDNFVLIKENYDAEYLARVVADCGCENVEATINTTYLQDLFGTGPEDADESVWTAVGEFLRDCWKARAEALFPEREFEATFAWYSEGGDPGVTLYQIKRTD